MLIKIITVTGLVLSLVLLTIAGLQPPLDYESAVEMVKGREREPVHRSAARVEFYPVVPKPLPDLYEGYLFNEERDLAREDEVQDEESAEVNEGIRVNIEEVNYVGSLIVGDVRTGLISYPNKPEPAQARKDRQGRKAVQKKTIKQRNYQQVLVGETFSDYKVVAVESDRIEFAGGGKTVVKQLYDPDKERLAPPKVVSPPKKNRFPPKTTTRKAVVRKSRRLELGATPVMSKPVNGTGSRPARTSAQPGRFLPRPRQN